jgi:hypothetical protein
LQTLKNSISGSTYVPIRGTVWRLKQIRNDLKRRIQRKDYLFGVCLPVRRENLKQIALFLDECLLIPEIRLKIPSS